MGKSVLKAVEKVNTEISKILIGITCEDQKKIDQSLIELDNTAQKKFLGANAMLSVSLAACKASSISKKIPLYRNLGDHKTLPFPLLNIINGGAHANNSLKIQEFMIRPDKAKSFKEAINISYLIIKKLKNIMIKKNFSTAVGDEGGFAPSLSSNEAAIDFILESIEKAGFTPGNDVSICLDVAANELFKKKKYSINSKDYISSDDVIDYYSGLLKKYPIKSIEDPFSEDDWNAWVKLSNSINKKIQIVGDDLFVTNSKRLEKGIEQNSANSILIKVNQIGTLSETFHSIDIARKNNYSYIISHRSGETEDNFIADLSVATESCQIKTGSLTRSDRVSKYNQLIRIEEFLDKNAKYAGKSILK